MARRRVHFSWDLGSLISYSKSRRDHTDRAKIGNELLYADCV
jgi:hypothetical protein